MLRFAAAVAALASTLVASAARADEGAPPPWKIGLTPFVGAGVAALTHGGDYPSFVAMTLLGAELQYHSDKVGGFGRAYFLSSGADGRWTAPGFALGGSYNLRGDGWDSMAIYARGALVYERWHATSHGTGCNVQLFLPLQCPDYVPPPGFAGATAPSGTRVTTDAFGIAPGLRLEMPLHKVYVAFDVEAVAASGFSSDAPGSVFELRAAIVIGARDRRSASGEAIEAPEYRRRQRRLE